MSCSTPITASREEIVAFARDPRHLTRICWRDADGKLVARTLAETLELVKQGERGSLSIRVSAHDAFLAIRGHDEVVDEDDKARAA